MAASISVLAGFAGAVVDAAPSNAAPGCPCSIFSPSSVPTNADATFDTRPVELGVKFKADVNGFVSAIRFYKGIGNTGTHVGHLWTADGTLLASTTFTAETATGWEQANLATPVAITAGAIYVASYFAPNGNYAYDYNGLAADVDSPPLHALADGASGPDGVYVYTPPGGFPASGFSASNYWVDVVFQIETPTTTAIVSSQSPSVYGRPVTFTATVTPAVTLGSPTGTVTFSDGSTNLGAIPVSNGVASLTTSGLSAGSHTITASYSGSANGIFLPSAASLAQTVAKAPTKLVATDADKDLGLVDVKFSATLTRPDTVAPVAGQVVVFTITNSGRFLCRATTSMTGTATCSADLTLLEGLLATKYTASFGGTANYLGSSANARFF